MRGRPARGGTIESLASGGRRARPVATPIPGKGGSASTGGVLLAPLQRERKWTEVQMGQSFICAFAPGGFRLQPTPRIGLSYSMRIALYEPDIPQNTGTILRLAACLGVEAHIIEPAGFPVTDRAFRRAGMDYLDAVAIVRHPGWADFERWRQHDGARLILFSTRGDVPYLDTVSAPTTCCCLGASRPVFPTACTRPLTHGW